MEELSFQCPYCLTKIRTVTGPSAITERHIRDCEVCCNPIEIGFGFVKAME